MSFRNLTGRTLTISMLCLGSVTPLGAQAYQSSFSEVKYDRAKAPASMFSAVQVDIASGAASIDIPCGPGIGERGLRFRPTLSLRAAPQLGVSSVDETHLTYTSAAGIQHFVTQTYDTLYQRGYGSSSFTPGTFDLALWGAYDQLSTYSLPGGGGGSVLGAVPPAMTEAAATALLSRFNISGTVATLPQLGSTPSGPFIQVGTTGHLVIGLHDTTGDVQDWLYLENIGATLMPQYHWPRRILVIQGDVAVEYTYVSHRFNNQPRPDTYAGNRNVLHSAHYVVTRIANRFNESISFAYDANGLGYKATWNTTPDPGVSIRVTVQGQEAAPVMPSLSRVGSNVGPVTPVLVTYEGITPALSSFRVVLANVGALNALPLESGGQPGSASALDLHGLRRTSTYWGEAALTVQPVSVTQQFLDSALNESVQFGYGSGPASSWDWLSITPTVLRTVTFSNRQIFLDWEAYRYKPNYSPNEETITSGPRLRPAIAYGVRVVEDIDTISGAARGTGYTRVVPVLNWATHVPQQGDSLEEFWINPTFYTAVTGPDGQTAVHHFLEPGPANQSVGGEAPMSLGYLKHLQKEVRYYARGVDWRADLGAAGSGGSAYRIVVTDHFDAHSIGSPTGSVALNPVPSATRTRTWERDSQTLAGSETEAWSSEQLGWTQIRQITDLDPSPELGFEFTKGPDGSLTQSAGTTTVVARTLENLIPEWLFGRIGMETTSRQDNTGNGTSSGAPPSVSRTLDPVFNTLTGTVLGSSTAGITTSLPHGSSGPAAAQVQRAILTGPDLIHSGQAGVDLFLYDDYGFLKSIQIQTGSTTLTTSQAQDAIGRPTSQTDAGGRVTYFSRDPAGRLTTITPPGGEESTVITYASNHHQVTVTQGARCSEYVFNGFGKRVLERRRDPNGAWSHRVFAYDTAGRTTGVTLWLAGAGIDHETWWQRENLFKDVVVVTPGDTICRRWGPINPDTGERDCIQWQTTAPTTTTYPALSAGATTEYDTRGREVRAKDSAGVVTTTSYPVNPGFMKVVMVAGLKTTTFIHDSAGRLKQVTDAANQVTRYVFDGSDRVTDVRQYYTPTDFQPRTWAYDALGRLTGLIQPESGLTLFSDFTVLGAATTANYNGRVLHRTFDWVDRPLTTTDDSGSVNQAFTYDINGKAGKLDSSRDGATTATYAYFAGTGRLSGLTTVAGGQTFTQTFTYDAYGQRTGGNNSHANWSQTYHDAAGLPQALTHGGVFVASSGTWNTGFDPVTWLPKAITYANSATTTFEFGGDQQRLGRITLRGAGSALVEDWTYGYDEVGNINKVNDLRNPGLFDYYGYDSLNRLITAVTQSPSFGEQLQTFEYDAFGNRTKGTTERVLGWSGARGTSTASVVPTTVSATANFTLNPLDPALTQRNQLPANTTNGAATGKVYDAQGNLLQVYQSPGDVANTLAMTYDALGRVIQARHMGKGTREDYAYRADGLRTVIDVYQGDVYQKTRFQIYNDLRQLVAQYEKVGAGSLTWKKDIAYLGTQEAGEIDASGITVTQVDHLGTPRVMTRPGGQVVRQKYLPFGETLEGAVPQTAKGYTNHEQTDVSGLIYMQARMYLPQYGRFASPDPARDQHFELTQSWNIYSYVRNNPVMATDPTGMVEEEAKFDHAEFLRSGQHIAPHAQQSADGNMAGMVATMNAASAQNAKAQAGLGADAPPAGPPSKGPDGKPIQGVPQTPSGQWLDAITVPGNDPRSWTIQWKLAIPSKAGGWIVQEITATNPDGTPDRHFWEAWRVSVGSTVTIYNGSFAYDDKFRAPSGETVLGSARFYEGLSLPSTFIPNNKDTYARILPSTTINPNLPLNNATAPLYRLWTAP